jgi:hypothetical protein
MTECFAVSDLKALAEDALSRFDQRVAALLQDLCAPFNQEAVRLEAELLTIYKVVLQIVRKEDDLAGIASWWGTMVSQCDQFSKRLNDLSVAHPGCGAEAFHNRVLDLRNKCHRLQQMHS